MVTPRTPTLSRLNQRQVLQLQERGTISSQAAANELARRRKAAADAKRREDIRRERIEERTEARVLTERALSTPKARKIAEDVLAARKLPKIQGVSKPRVTPTTTTPPKTAVRRSESVSAVKRTLVVSPAQKQIAQIRAQIAENLPDKTSGRVDFGKLRQSQKAAAQARRIKLASVGELASVLRRPGVSTNKLIQAGADKAKVQQAARLAVAQRRLDEFRAPSGDVRLGDAIKDRVPDQVLRNAGFSVDQIRLAKDTNASLARIESLPSSKPKSKTARVIQDVLSETFTLTGRETETFNKKDLEKQYDRSASQLNKVYNEKLIQLAKEGKGTKPITTRDQFIGQNLGTKDGYVSGVLAQQNNIEALTAKTKQVGRFSKQVALASVPIYGTIRTWDEDPAWARAVSVAADVAFFIPIVGQVSAGVRTGRGLRAIAKETAIASIRAETLGQIEAIAHPIRTIKGTARPFADILNPSRVPTSSVAFRDATIRLPAEKEFFNKYGGHAAYPFALKVTPATVEGLGVATVGATKGAAVRFPSNKAAKDFLKGRDIATMRLVRGESGKAFIGTDATGKSISVDIPKAPFSKSVGAAAFHGTPDLRPYIPGMEIAGKEGGLFIAPTALTRFIRGSGSGKAADLAPEVRKAIDALPDKTKAALSVNRMVDKPMPGALVIRDPELLKQLQGSGKFWNGTAEIELIVPNGVKVPPPSQFIKTRNDAGETIHLAIIGKPLSAREIARLKFIGAKETVGSIFSKTGSVTARNFGTADRRQQQILRQMGKDADEAEKLFLDASTARKAGNIKESNELIERAERLANDSAQSLTRSQIRAGITLSRGRIEPGVVYTGRQDIERALTQSGLGKAPTGRVIAENKKRNSTSTVVAKPAGARRRKVDTEETGRRQPPEAPTTKGRVVVFPPLPTDPRRPPTPGPGPRRRVTPVAGPPERRPPAPTPTERQRVLGPTPPGDPRRRLPPKIPSTTRFDLPNNQTKKLKKGEFPRVVTWQQGLFNITVDIDKGTRTFSKAGSTGKAVTPNSTFTVLTKDKSRPVGRVFRQGAVDLQVTPRSISFAGRKGKSLRK